MDASDLAAGLETTGYPVAYRAFKSAQEPPFICYLFVGSADLMADDSNYYPAGDYLVELYTNDKDPTAEAAVEAALAALGLPYGKGPETYIETEQMFQMPYAVRLQSSAEDEVS